MKNVLIAIRLLLGGLFVFAGATKMLNPQTFADSIAAYQILPFAVINPIAEGLPVFECITGLFLIAGWKCRAWALAVTGMLLIFTIGIGIGVVRGLHNNCGCFGDTWLDDQPPVAFFRDIVLLGLSTALYVAELRINAFKEPNVELSSKTL